MKIKQQSTGNMRTKPTITDINKRIRVSPMIFIAPWDYSFWTTENPTRNLEGIYYQQHDLNFNVWMISPCDDSSWTPENPNQNLEEILITTEFELKWLNEMNTTINCI